MKVTDPLIIPTKGVPHREAIPWKRRRIPKLDESFSIPSRSVRTMVLKAMKAAGNTIISYQKGLQKRDIYFKEHRIFPFHCFAECFYSSGFRTYSQYWRKSDMAFRWEHRESNLMFTLSSHKNQGKMSLCVFTFALTIVRRFITLVCYGTVCNQI